VIPNYRDQTNCPGGVIAPPNDDSRDSARCSSEFGRCCLIGFLRGQLINHGTPPTPTVTQSNPTRVKIAIRELPAPVLPVAGGVRLLGYEAQGLFSSAYSGREVSACRNNSSKTFTSSNRIERTYLILILSQFLLDKSRERFFTLYNY
jgi:hypothetical protein